MPSCFSPLGHASASPRPSVSRPIAFTKNPLPNGCLVDSIACKGTLDAKQKLARRWSRVLILGWWEKGSIKGHALCLFEFNPHLSAYDPASGTIPLNKRRSLKTQPDQLAKLCLGANATRLLWSEFP